MLPFLKVKSPRSPGLTERRESRTAEGEKEEEEETNGERRWVGVERDAGSLLDNSTSPRSCLNEIRKCVSSEVNLPPTAPTQRTSLDLHLNQNK